MALDISELCKQVVPTVSVNGVAVMSMETLSSDAYPCVHLMGADDVDAEESPGAADADDEEDDEDDDEDADDEEDDEDDEDDDTEGVEQE